MPVSVSSLSPALKARLKRIPGLDRLYQTLKARRAAAQAGHHSAQRDQKDRIDFDLNLIKQFVTQQAQDQLSEFLYSTGRLQFPWVVNPKVTVILVLFNRAELTLACLRSLLESLEPTLELVVIDNRSSDLTERLFAQVDGVRYVRNSENLHFLLGCNQGAALAGGEYLLFLNSDTIVLPGSIARAVEAFDSTEVGAVGGKLILPNGRLQEAGSIVWSDGTCLGYGRGDDPFRAQYMYRREVDFCSGAFLLTPRRLFEQLGGFSLDFKPAYYEETDYCMRLWESGFKVRYEPRCVIQHFEFASSSHNQKALQMQIERRAVFCEKHRDSLSSRLAPASENVLPARSRSQERRLLFLDERLPHNWSGAGYPRANQMVRAAISAGYFVTVFPVLQVDAEEDWERLYRDIPREAEVLAFPPFGPGKLEELLRERQGFYQTILVSRPTTMEALKQIRERSPELFAGARLIYDAEAIFSLREELYAQVIGKPLSADALKGKLSKELGLACGVDAISAVSPQEAKKFREHGFSRVQVISHAITPRPSSCSFEERRGILFAGAIYDDFGSNPDAVFWFIEKVMPHFKELHFSAELEIVGTNHSARLNQQVFPGVRVLGRVPDLACHYAAARIFIAPTRFSAGIPLKVIEAAAQGVPVVASPLVARQLDWQDGKELLAAEDPLEFAKKCRALHDDPQMWSGIRQAALERVSREYSRESMVRSMRELLAEGS